jgi:hypothetical protein
MSSLLRLYFQEKPRVVRARRAALEQRLQEEKRHEEHS